MDLLINGVAQDGFSIVPEIASDRVTLTLTLKGSCDSHVLPVLEQFLANVHVEVVRGGAKVVVLDCESLYFMNSSSVKSFVTWLMKVSGTPPHERYQVRVRTNRRLAWQARTFGAIYRSAPGVLTLDP
jgi:hypothetical protein